MLRPSLVSPLVALLASSLLPTPVISQLTTDCNPLNETCPADPAFGTNYTFNFNSSAPYGTFDTTAGTVDYSADNFAAFTITEKGYSPTLISNFYFFGGKTEVIMKAASGTGIISSIVWSSDVLDEVDWEFLGGNSTHASTNYFGKGHQDFHNAGYHPVNGSTQDDWHNYTCVWTQDKLEWHIDGELVRTLLAVDANNTLYYPQTPMKLSLGIWAGGDSDQPQGTIEWAGGLTDYSQGPFTMYVKSAYVEDYSTGKEYTYSDKSGDWDSIKITEGNSTAVENINREPETDKSLSEKWDALPQSTKSGIYAAAGGVGALLFVSLLFYYIKQRRRGQQEAALAAQRDEQDRVELERFQKEGRDPDNLAFDGADYGYAGAKGVGVAAYSVPASPPGSSAGPPEKAWDPTSGSNAAAMPLLGRTTSPPAGSEFRGPPRNNSLASTMSPQANQFPQPLSPVHRSFSPSNVPARVDSPGTQSGHGVPRINSPASVTSPGSYRGPGSPSAQNPPNHDQGYWR
ncbi:glycoside hydrolase family 16 protein [Xylariomycetidae sp. FL2044]|nr:glycoside hydrolase family 16 protein [Xylariomycetidae sp. FL2044]